jgi:phosphatidylinositol alpha 1,6-mannosyltransferase
MVANKQLTIIVFADVILGPNGVRSQCKTLREWSRRIDDLRVVVVTPGRNGDKADSADGDTVSISPSVRLPNPLYRDFLLGYYSQSQLRKIVESIDGPKIVHIATPGRLGASAATLARNMNLPIVGCYHVDTKAQCVEPYFHVGGWIGGAIARFIDRRAYGECQALCAPSQSAADAAKNFYPGEVLVIPNPIDTEHYRPAESRNGAFRDRYAADGKVLAVVVGRMAREKNLDLICEHLLGDERIHTVFVGDGPYGSQLRDRWHATVTGFLHGDDLLAAYQQADVFVQLSVRETFGLTLLEAMSCGLPAIIARGNGLADVISAREGVEVIDVEDAATLADRCVAMVRARAVHDERSRLVRRFAETLGADAVLPRFIDFHRQAVG